LQIVSRDKHLATPRAVTRAAGESPAATAAAALRLAWLPFLTSRLALFAVAWAVNVRFPYGRPNDPLVFEPAWRAWLAWDGLHYLRLANVGYPHWASHPESGYPPLLPLLIHLLGGSAAAALALAFVGGLAGLGILTGLTRAIFDERVASRTAWVAAWWPLGFVWTAVYTEGLFLALAAGALWAAWRSRALLAGALSFLAATLRVTGVGLVLPLLALLPAGWARLAALAPVAGVLFFGGYQWYVTGDPLAFVHAQMAGRPHMHPLQPFQALDHPGAGGGWELLVGLLALVLVVALIAVLVLEPRWRVASLAVVAGFLGPVLAAGTVFSLGRYAMVAFPLYWALQRAPTRFLVAAGVPAALLVTALAGNGRLTP